MTSFTSDAMIYIPPSMLINVERPPDNGTWSFMFEAPGFGDTIDMLPLFHTLLAYNPSWKIIFQTNHHLIPFHLLHPNIQTTSLGDRTITPSKTTIVLDETIDYPINCPNWLRYCIAAGQSQIIAHDDPFPFLELPAELVFETRGLPCPPRFILQHHYNTRVSFEGRNTDPKNLDYVVKKLEQQGGVIFEIGNDCPPTGSRPHLSNLSFEELFALVKASEGFVGIDSFPMHVAALYRKPILGFFGATHPLSVLPCFGPVVNVSHVDLACINCQAFNKPYNINKCIWHDERCGRRFPDSYLDGCVEQFEALTNKKHNRTFFIDRSMFEYIVKIGKSEYELQKALELCMSHLPKELAIYASLAALRSPAELMEKSPSFHAYVQHRFLDVPPMVLTST